jgi:carbamoyltransferase
MLILSIYAGHDAAVCLLEDGRLLLNLELERHTRVRYDFGWDSDFVQHCLERAGRRIEDVDLLCVNQAMSLPVYRRRDKDPPPFALKHIGERRVVPLVAPLFDRMLPTLAIEHHLAHAACAYFTSPFDDACILTIDGIGDLGDSSVARGKANKIHGYVPGLTDELLGAWWAWITTNNYRMTPRHVGETNAGAGKIMALAAYGRHDQDIERRFRADMASAPRDYEAFHHFNDNEDLSDTHHPRSQALARALQNFTDLAITDRMRRLDTPSSPRNLCYAGGVALNCIANARGFLASGFDALHVPPCPNDCGLALGMALLAYHHVLGNPFRPGAFSPYTGPQYRPVEVETAIARAKARRGDLAIAKTDPRRLVDLLADGEIMCVWRGASECGPRALGHRSIICRTDLPDIRRRLNEAKQREWYRPFAPIILAEHAADLLESPVRYSRYMTTSSVIRAPWRERLAGVNHIDGTTRPQVIERDMEPFIHTLISDLARRTGIPAVLNTSFNMREPMVETPDDALATFLEMPFNHLWLDGNLVSKPN